MNTESNTPPNGDFARYVEQLSARAGQSARVPGKESEHGLDVGMTPSPGAQGATVARRESQAGEAAKADGTKAIPLGTLKVLAGMGAMVFLGLWAIGVPLSVLVLGAAAAAWFGKRFLKGLNLRPGVAKWQQVLEEAARRQKEQQQK
ncbi:hypothetical protein J2W25_006680 [Variovorax boronicumulans]|uniref:Uncharacterized protein n=1 Tax=Variovorax boronicumulans TaxID=436515 RepID=A0AAW8E5W0_9BURK|nr:hypothetical protein [Variovorax boronicumulans]MDP9882340.1 hypothetical protein [Variovorax boronicumulans]MDP9920809.1 hypothetical protein [Variovorax boronicumulans]MDP9927626.1 hypothetical protein [Variovorax boronicumulans]